MKKAIKDAAKVNDVIKWIATITAQRNEKRNYMDDLLLSDNGISFQWKENIKHRPIMKLDEDILKAIQKLDALEKINNNLPDLIAELVVPPVVGALAEDIVRGMADETDCIFKLRERVRQLALQMSELESKCHLFLTKNKPMEMVNRL